MAENEVSFFDLLKEEINKSVSLISRAELVNKFCRSSLNFNEQTLDTYRRKLSVVGFISEGNGRGLYRKLKNVPSSYNTSDLIDDYQIILNSRK